MPYNSLEWALTIPGKIEANHILLNLAVELMLSKRQRSEFLERPEESRPLMQFGLHCCLKLAGTLLWWKQRGSFSLSRCISVVASGLVSQYVCGRREHRGQNYLFNWLSFTRRRRENHPTYSSVYYFLCFLASCLSSFFSSSLLVDVFLLNLHCCVSVMWSTCHCWGETGVKVVTLQCDETK